MGKFDKVSFMLPIADIESSALDQIEKVAALDFVKRVAIMPDCHTGYDMPIGGVALLDNVISPSYVGYDIGCGVLHYPLGISQEDFFEHVDLLGLFHTIHKNIPTGTGRFSNSEIGDFKSSLGDKDLDEEVRANQYAQLGTLGSGNHFIEFGVSAATKEVGVTIHSGSRNLGHRICTHYLKREKWFAFDSLLGRAYYEDMRFAVDWAVTNRLSMLEAVIESLEDFFEEGEFEIGFEEELVIDVPHNYAQILEDGILHRKGATPAMAGQYGIIPGNMRDGVYIVQGLGNEDYLCSSSHGAGRTMSRSKAKEAFTVEQFEEEMHGIVASVSKHTLDESPMAYKNLEEVIDRQQGIVIDVVNHFKPILNIKG